MFRTMTEAEAVEMYVTEYDELISVGLGKEPDYSKWLTGGRTKAETDIANRRTRGAEQVAGYIRYAEQAPEQPWTWLDGNPAVEVEFSLDLDGVTVKGYIDIINEWPDGQLTPRDYKTGTKRPDWPFQLVLYGLAIEQETGYRPTYGDFYIAKDNRPDAPVNITNYSREAVTRWFHDMDRAEKAGIYLPNPGDACRVCTVSDFCSVKGSRANEFQPEGISNDD